MGTPEIFLEHKRGEKVQKYLRVRPDRDLFVIGSSREADLRISGDGVAGCHAVLRYRAPHWYVCDVSGTESLRVNDRVVTESIITATADVEIGSHKIKLFAKDKENDLFKDGEESTGLALHQVVVRLKGRVLETRVLGANEKFKFFDGETSTELNPPTSGKWVTTEVGLRTIQQRLVGPQEVLSAEGITFDRDLRKPLMTALMVMCFLLGSVWLMSLGSKDKAPEVALDNRSKEIIFDAKTIKKKREESRKVVREKAAKAKAGGTTSSASAPVAQRAAPEESTAPKVSAKASRALTSLRNSGLSALVGKIAKRANKQGVMVAAVGVSPDKAGTGRALFSTGTTLNGGGGSAAKEGPTYRLGGVATRGKGGGIGAGHIRDGTALAGGSVGTGNVLALVDDEETVIEGGLDRDAIAEVIKRNLGQIRYCYERQLSSNPDLYGKVLVRFTIGAAGDVSQQRVDNSTLKSQMVEGCILRRMASWKFPLPKGGTQVKVSYPFLFKALE